MDLTIPCKNCGHPIPLDFAYSKSEWSCPNCGTEHVNKIDYAFDGVERLAKNVKKLIDRVDVLERQLEEVQEDRWKNDEALEKRIATLERVNQGKW